VRDVAPFGAYKHCCCCCCFEHTPCTSLRRRSSHLTILDEQSGRLAQALVLPQPIQQVLLKLRHLAISAGCQASFSILLNFHMNCGLFASNWRAAQGYACCAGRKRETAEMARGCRVESQQGNCALRKSLEPPKMRLSWVGCCCWTQLHSYMVTVVVTPIAKLLMVPGVQ